MSNTRTANTLTIGDEILKGDAGHQKRYRVARTDARAWSSNEVTTMGLLGDDGIVHKFQCYSDTKFTVVSS